MVQAVRLAAERGLRVGGQVRRPQLGRQPPARRRPAARRVPPRPARRRSRGDDRGRRARRARHHRRRWPSRASSSRAGTARASRVGGYLLQGGFGWNGRVHGPACMSVEAIDVVTADGELIHADETQHAGSALGGARRGPGLLRRRRRASTCASTRLRGTSPAAWSASRSMLAEEVFTLGPRRSGPTIPREVELSIFVHRGEGGEPEIMVTAPALVDTRRAGRRGARVHRRVPAAATAPLESCPAASVTLADLYASVHAFYPDGARYAVDNMWTHAPVGGADSGHRRDRADAAAGALGDALGELGRRRAAAAVDGLQRRGPDLHRRLRRSGTTPPTTSATRPGRRSACGRWSTSPAASSSPTRTSAARPARFVSDENLARLDEIRAQYDPDGRFHPWMGRVDQTEDALS